MSYSSEKSHYGSKSPFERGFVTLVFVASIFLVTPTFKVHANSATVTVTNPTTHNFTFVIEQKSRSLDGYNKLIYTINDTSPGPQINVTKGDSVNVLVINKCFSQSTSIHWHGVRQINTTYQDGVPYVSQYPIAPGSTFTYSFTLHDAGTFWYHSHVGTQRSDGTYGMLIVTDPNDDYGSMINGSDTSLILQEWTHLLHDEVTGALIDFSMKTWEGPHQTTIMNGQGKFNCSTISNRNFEVNIGTPLHDCQSNTTFYTLTLENGRTHRLRVLNSSPSRTLVFSVDNHPLQVIAVDGVNVLKFTCERVAIYPAQRYDVLITLNQASSGYWIRAETLNASQEMGQSILLYSDTPTWSTNALPSFQPWNNQSLTLLNTETSLYSAPSIPSPLTSDYNLTLTVWCSESIYECYINGNIFQHPNISPLLSTWLGESVGAVHISNVSSPNYPSPPPLRGPTDFLPTTGPFIVDIPLNSVVEITINNINTIQTHPMHLHGHNIFILGTGQPGDGKFDPVRNPLNRDNPVLRDTHPVNLNSWMVWSFKADNPGIWPLHCHFEAHLAAGMMMLFRVGAEQVQNLPAFVPPSNWPVQVSFAQAYLNPNECGSALNSVNGGGSRARYSGAWGIQMYLTMTTIVAICYLQY